MRTTPNGPARRAPLYTLLAAGVAAMVGAAGLAAPAHATAAGPVPAPAAGPAAADAAPVDVIVRTDGPAGLRAAADAVRRAGGTVGRSLDVIDGLAAQVPPGALPALRAVAGVRAVTADATVRMKAGEWRDEPGANWITDIRRLTIPATLTGAGVGVALIDSGVAPVPGLNQPGKVINGPDLSFESQAPNLRQLDTFGHGTHMAGVIAATDPTTVAGRTRADGVAPGAHLISLKVAAADGAADVSQVIAAIDWVVQHRSDPGLNIRVLNLSFGTDSVQSAQLDPLSYAVEAAWRKGIVVVVSVGNDGLTAPRVTMPAANPYVIAVGAADTKSNLIPADDTVAEFSNRGNLNRHADLIAPGRAIISLRAPGTFVDTNYPGARVSDGVAQRFFRGSGTSQAAAIVSGAAALLLQQRPSLTPDQVKRLLTSTAYRLTGADPVAMGAGELNIKGAAAAATPTTATQTWPAATGLGTLEGARGTAHVADSESGAVLTGERDIFGAAWAPRTWTPLAKAGTAWSGGTWNGNAWAGSAWTGSSWTARTWSSTTWTARTWSGSTWTARTWSSAVWTGGTWSARTWSARTWSARTWSSLLWPGQPWP
jgi:serine protease AprX